MIIRAEVPEALIHENIHRIMEMKPIYVPEPLDPRMEILKVKPGGGAPGSRISEVQGTSESEGDLLCLVLRVDR